MVNYNTSVFLLRVEAVEYTGRQHEITTVTIIYIFYFRLNLKKGKGKRESKCTVLITKVNHLIKGRPV